MRDRFKLPLVAIAAVAVGWVVTVGCGQQTSQAPPPKLPTLVGFSVMPQHDFSGLGGNILVYRAWSDGQVDLTVTLPAAAAEVISQIVVHEGKPQPNQKDVDQ